MKYIKSWFFIDLSATQGLAEGATLLFSGGSAGGRGAMAWLDAIPKMVPKGVTVLGLLDSVSVWLCVWEKKRVIEKRVRALTITSPHPPCRVTTWTSTRTPRSSRLTS